MNKVVKVFTPDDTWTTKHGTFKSHYIDLEDGRRIVVNTKVREDGGTKTFEQGKEYDFDISAEKNKTGRFFKAKHVTLKPVQCPECGHEFTPSFSNKGTKDASTPKSQPRPSHAATEQSESPPPVDTTDRTPLSELDF